MGQAAIELLFYWKCDDHLLELGLLHPKTKRAFQVNKSWGLKLQKTCLTSGTIINLWMFTWPIFETSANSKLLKRVTLWKSASWFAGKSPD